MPDNPESLQPVDLQARQAEGQLTIGWADGHTSPFGYVYLRGECQCARCINELTGQRMLDPSTIPSDLQLDSMNLVGNYAVRVEWRQGNHTSLYTWVQLRKICPCEACRGSAATA